MKRRGPPYLWTVGQLIVAGGLLALLWKAADGPSAAQSLATADWPWLACAVGLLTVQTILSAVRWQVTARALGISFGVGHAIREYYLAQVVNQSLPGGMVGDAARASFWTGSIRAGSAGVAAPGPSGSRPSGQDRKTGAPWPVGGPARIAAGGGRRGRYVRRGRWTWRHASPEAGGGEEGARGGCPGWDRGLRC